MNGKREDQGCSNQSEERSNRLRERCSQSEERSNRLEGRRNQREERSNR